MTECKPCGVTWTGTLTCHCCARTGGCGLVFSGITNFDYHRLEQHKQRVCVHPRNRGMVLTRPGVWGTVLKVSENPDVPTFPGQSGEPDG